MAGTIKISLVRSPIAAPGKLKRVVRGLGLIRLGQTVERPDRPEIWGMIRKIPHLVEVKR